MSMKLQLEQDLARAEAVIMADGGTKKLHGPTVDNFKGQALAYKRALALLEMQKITPPGPVEIHRTYTINIPGIVVALLALCGILILL